MVPCPKCSGNTQVLYTITVDNKVIRHRHCIACTYDWHTMECLLVDDDLSKTLAKEMASAVAKRNTLNMTKKLVNKYRVSSEDVVITERLMATRK